MPNSPINTQLEIAQVCDRLKNFLIEKNEKYGDSALSPLRIFSSSDISEQLNVRIDDKLSRISNQHSGEDEDPEWDLLGYLVLKQVQKLRQGK